MSAIRVLLVAFLIVCFTVGCNAGPSVTTPSTPIPTIPPFPVEDNPQTGATPSPAPAPTTMPRPSAIPRPTPTATPAPTSNPIPTAIPLPTSNPAPTAAPEPTPPPNHVDRFTYECKGLVAKPFSFCCGEFPERCTERTNVDIIPGVDDDFFQQKKLASTSSYALWFKQLGKRISLSLETGGSTIASVSTEAGNGKLELKGDLPWELAYHARCQRKNLPERNPNEVAANRVCRGTLYESGLPEWQHKWHTVIIFLKYENATQDLFESKEHRLEFTPITKTFGRFDVKKKSCGSPIVATFFADLYDRPSILSMSLGGTGAQLTLYCED